MLSVELGELIHKMVCGLHLGKNSEQAAGLASPDYLRLGDPTKALYLDFDIRASYYPSTEDSKKLKAGNAACSLHYLFNRTYGNTGFCSTHTFAAVDTNPFADLSKVKNWKFLSSHDSCWKDSAAQFAWEVQQNIYNQVYSQVGFTDKDHVPYNRLSWNVWFRTRNLTTQFYEWVSVQIERDPEDNLNYRKLIKIL